ncbi:alpha/beta hydrolase family protein [Actinomycetota bacterium Odt1-20B]
MKQKPSKSMRPLTRRSLLGLAATGAVAATLLPVPASATARPATPVRAELPAPTGPHAVGTYATRLVDRSRHDPWVSGQPYRELMVSVWYPAAKGAAHGHRLAPYMTPGAARAWDAAAGQHGIPKGAVDWAGTRTHAYAGAPVDTTGGRRPVLLYTSGAGDPRTWNTSLVEELASRGYVVVTVDHTYEAPGVEFPGGRVVDNAPLMKAFAEADKENKVPALLKKVGDVRAADDSFVLDSLGSLPKGLGKVMNLRQVGAVGQSAGGIAAAQTMDQDHRIKAGINMDGTLEYNQEPKGTNFMPVARHGLDRPFLLMGSDRPTEPSWKEFLSRTKGWKQNLALRGSQHQTYTDLTPVLPQTGVGRKVLEKNIGTVRPKRAVAAQRAYVTSFFDHWLRDRDDHLLDGPSARWPEMKFAK